MSEVKYCCDDFERLLKFQTNQRNAPIKQFQWGYYIYIAFPFSNELSKKAHSLYWEYLKYCFFCGSRLEGYLHDKKMSEKERERERIKMALFMHFHMKTNKYGITAYGIGLLPERDSKIMLSRIQGMTLKQAGEQFDLSKERIRLIEKKVIRNLLRHKEKQKCFSDLEIFS